MPRPCNDDHGDPVDDIEYAHALALAHETAVAYKVERSKPRRDALLAAYAVTNAEHDRRKAAAGAR